MAASEITGVMKNVFSVLLLVTFISYGNAPLLPAGNMPEKESSSTGAVRPGRSSAARLVKWSGVKMNGARTGCKSPSATDIEKTVGTFDGRTYIAPNGVRYRKGTVAKVAGMVLDAQPVMAPVKKVVGYSPEEMVRSYPECALSNLFIDTIMAATEKASGKHVDIGIGNFGGIRTDMPEGDILVDDIMSMFPFKNTIVYVSIKGKDIRDILDCMAATRFQVLGGVKVVAEGGEIVSAEVGGEPLDDERVYGLATISFLLNGGDDLFLGKNALSIEEFGDMDIYDVIMEYVTSETAAGRDIVYSADGRVIIR